MNNAGKTWSQEENGTLIREYTINQFDVIKIAELHGRTPISIMCKLKANHIISNEMEARGYNRYMELKTENPNAFVVQRAPRDTSTTAAPSNTPSSNALLTEITNMKKEIHELRNEIRELTALMKASFEFEEVEEEVTTD